MYSKHNPYNRHRRHLLPALAAACLTAACAVTAACGGDDTPSGPSTPDYVPDYLVQVRVVGDDGLNLLDSRYDNNVLRDSVSALYDGHTYALDTVLAYSADTDTKGIVLKRFAPSGSYQYLMYFGPLDGKTDVSAKDIILRWNKGRKDDTVTVSHQYTTLADGTPHTATQLWLNHKAVDMSKPVTVTPVAK